MYNGIRRMLFPVMTKLNNINREISITRDVCDSFRLYTGRGGPQLQGGGY